MVPVNHMTEVGRLEARLEEVLGASPRDDVACIAALEEAVALTRTDPAATEDVFYLPELLDELAEAYGAAGRVDDALQAMRQAIDAGHEGAPDSRCRLAEILMRAGRVEEAEPIWAQVRADTPDDVWLYNNAGLEYAAIGDDSTALAWLTDGLRLAVDTDDPERIIGQLIHLRAASMTALGLPSDDLQSRAKDIHAARRRDSRQRVLRTMAQLPHDTEPAAVIPTPMPESKVWTWFPSSEYDKARAQWPGLTEPDGLAAGGRPHPEYCRALQGKLAEAANAGMTGIRIAPIRVDVLVAWCADRGQDPAGARADYVAHLTRTDPEQLISWPPRRNEPCWCGSARKYKKCCGAPGTGERG